MIEFDILARFSDEVNFTAEIDCAEDAPYSVKLGLAVKWGVEHDADLSNADLSNADLSNADLSNTNLWNTSLRSADLSNCNLSN
uniref:pentapeptide repeat-containing protein n=1 Tax=Lentibacter algarum TaxID=576131 RepID=UPI0026EE4857